MSNTQKYDSGLSLLLHALTGCAD